MTDPFEGIRDGDKVRISFEATVDLVARQAYVDGESADPRDDNIRLEGAPDDLHFNYLNSGQVQDGLFAVEVVPQIDDVTRDEQEHTPPPGVVERFGFRFATYPSGAVTVQDATGHLVDQYRTGSMGSDQPRGHHVALEAFAE